MTTVVGRMRYAWDFEEVGLWVRNLIQSFCEFFIFLDAGHGGMSAVVCCTGNAWDFQVVGLWGTVRFSLGIKGWN